ncbi:hypothetical protein JK386_14145 [Nocardioides sp. zg-536]|uniref:Uncharacterized protein n=1 Tax=Nocardioides faecalis TaxID=2803858 RepID=A0A939BZ79_9ACTN|nr:hypothetical protein [Nocardioides faecalis]MBM9461038.1 hypothetical protein [Nocardioides faecalis]QVI59125.1 hypothetical protein KG111_01685 [Nocardioides faecalis]
MGDSLPPKATVDLVGSYARRRGDRAEIVLSEPKEVVDGQGWAVLRRKDLEVSADLRLVTDERGRRYVVSCENAQLADGRWALILCGEDGQRQRVNARLLVQGERPLCLLWGTRPPESTKPIRHRDRPVVIPAPAGGPAPAAAPAARTQVRALAGKVKRRLAALR